MILVLQQSVVVVSVVLVVLLIVLLLFLGADKIRHIIRFYLFFLLVEHMRLWTFEMLNGERSMLAHFIGPQNPRPHSISSAAVWLFSIPVRNGVGGERIKLPHRRVSCSQSTRTIATQYDIYTTGVHGYEPTQLRLTLTSQRAWAYFPLRQAMYLSRHRGCASVDRGNENELACRALRIHLVQVSTIVVVVW